MNARRPTQEDQIVKDYSLFGGPDRLEPARVIMRGDLSGKRSRTPAWEKGYSGEMDEGMSQDLRKHNGTCTARQFWKGCDRPVTAPDSSDIVDFAYGFGIRWPTNKKFAWTIRRATFVDGMPEAFLCPIISRCVCEDDDPWPWQPLPVPSTWTCDAPSSYCEDRSQCPAAMEADTFPCFRRLLHPDSSRCLSVTLDTLSNYPQERRLGHANSDEEAPLRGPLVDPVSAGGSGFIQSGNPEPLSPELLSLSPSPTQDVEPQPYSTICSIRQPRACRRRLFDP